MKPINKIEWEGHTIEFIPVLSHRYLWVATVNELKFDGIKVATSGGLCFSAQAKATIQHNGSPVTIEVLSNTSFRSPNNLNFKLLIDGKLISSGFAKTRFQW